MVLVSKSKWYGYDCRSIFVYDITILTPRNLCLKSDNPEGWNWAYAYGRNFLVVYRGVNLIQLSSLLPSRLVIGTDGDLHLLLSSRAVRLFRLFCLVTKNSFWRHHVRVSTNISTDPNAPSNLVLWNCAKICREISSSSSDKNVGHLTCFIVAGGIKALSSCQMVSGCSDSCGGINIMRTRRMSRDKYTACLALIYLFSLP
jgi:hypothetical protein